MGRWILKQLIIMPDPISLNRAVIATYTSASVSEKRVVLSNGYIARKHNIGTSWNTMRVGVRIQTERGFGLSIPSYTMQFCLGISNGPYKGSTNYLDVVVTVASPSYVAASGANMAYWNMNGNTILFTVSASVGSYSAPFGNVGIFAADPTATTRRMFFADFIRGSGTFTARYFGCNSATAFPDVTTNDFLTQIVSATPTFANHTYTAA